MQDNSPISQDDQWRDWAAAAQGGDKRAYNALLSAIAPYIRGRIIGSLANADWADDITQEVLISVHKSLHSYSAERPFRPWLMAIVNFRRTDFLRSHYARRGDKQVSYEVLENQKQFVTQGAHAGEYKDVEKALRAMTGKQRKVFTMMKIEGYTAKEVAEATGMSVSAVKVSAHRTMIKLKDQLG